jgi:predicted nucleotidyltransferase
MRVTGIIVEYNPMHNGHCYHIRQAKETTHADAVVAVMSGHFLQRGEPAIVNKWARTRMALQNGVDLVLELPVVYSTQSARYFAYGSVATLDALGVVDTLCFGSEAGDIHSLKKAAGLIAKSPVPLQTLQEQELSRGTSYPRAMADALKRYAEKNEDFDPGVFDHPNNMLGIEYIHALIQLKSRIEPFTIRRIGASFHEESFPHPEIASATAIRQTILGQKVSDARRFMPANNALILEKEMQAGRAPVSWESFARPLFSLLLRAQTQDLLSYLHMDEGLAERLRTAVTRNTTVHALIRDVKTRRYTWTRIQRALTSLFLGLTKEKAEILDLRMGPTYIRVLGFNEKGRELLKAAASRSRLPLITNISRGIPPMMEWDISASRLYALAYADLRDDDFRMECLPPVMDGAADS